MASVAASADTIVTSKTYVDNRDNLKVDIAQGVGTNNANVGKTLIVNSQGNLELGEVAASNFVEDSITDGVTNKAPSENAVHDALANKQDKDTTQVYKVGQNGAWSAVENAVTNGTYATKSVNATTGAVTIDVNATTDGSLANAGTGGTDAAKIPTANAVKTYVDSQASSVATNILNGTQSTTDTTHALTNAATTTALNGKQATIPATGTNSATAGTTVITYTGTAGQIGERGIYSDASSYTAGTDANKLVAASALNTVQTAVTALQNCTHTCASSDGGTTPCDLITINCVTGGSQS